MISYVLAPLKEADSSPKGRKILWNDALESSFKEINCMVSVKMLLNDPYWKIPYTFHTDASDKQLVDVISHNNKIYLTKHLIISSLFLVLEKKALLLPYCFNQFTGMGFSIPFRVCVCVCDGSPRRVI